MLQALGLLGIVLVGLAIVYRLWWWNLGSVLEAPEAIVDTGSCPQPGELQRIEEWLGVQLPDFLRELHSGHSDASLLAPFDISFQGEEWRIQHFLRLRKASQKKLAHRLGLQEDQLGIAEDDFGNLYFIYSKANANLVFMYDMETGEVKETFPFKLIADAIKQKRGATEDK